MAREAEAPHPARGAAAGAPGLPLAGTRTLELGHIIAGPSGGVVLADLGSDVVKIENVDGGDQARRWKGNYSFSAFNRNKRSVSVDLKHPAGKAVFERLVATADVVLDNYSPGVLDRLGVGYEWGRAVNPRIIYCSVKGFTPGPYGDRPFLDELAQMMGGLAYMTGPIGQPLRAGASIVDIGAATYGVLGVVAALYQRTLTGQGQYVQAGLFETTVFWMSQHVAEVSATGQEVLPMAARGMGRRMGWGIYDLFETADGEQLFVAITSDAHWERFCREFGLLDLWEHPDLANNNLRVDHRDLSMPRLRAVMGELTRAELIRRLAAIDVPYAPVNKPGDLLRDEHLGSEDHLLDVQTPAGEAARAPALPMVSSAYRYGVRYQPPRLGQHTEAVLAELGYSAAEIGRLAADGAVRVEETTPHP
jgi:crotonobetainyl-CoA:carnitine CoA-transferase CaiB-like acyl-CoA transferase